jgi:hypothetical protein
MSALGLVALTDIFRGFAQSLQVNILRKYLLRLQIVIYNDLHTRCSVNNSVTYAITVRNYILRYCKDNALIGKCPKITHI